MCVYVCFLQKTCSPTFRSVWVTTECIFCVCSCPSSFHCVQFLNALSANLKWSIHVFSGFKKGASLSQHAFCYFGGFTRRLSVFHNTSSCSSVAIFNKATRTRYASCFAIVATNCFGSSWKIPQNNNKNKQETNKQKIKTAFGLVMHHQFASSCQTGSWVQNQREAIVASKRCLSMSLRSDVCFLLCDVMWTKKVIFFHTVCLKCHIAVRFETECV